MYTVHVHVHACLFLYMLADSWSLAITCLRLLGYQVQYIQCHVIHTHHDIDVA